MRPRARKLIRALGLAAASFALACLALEGLLRFVLFADLAREWGIGWRLRKPGLYAANESGRDFWKLDTLLAGDEAARVHPNFDRRLGRRSPQLDAETLAHADEPRLAGRTPVLLFGDSYAACLVAPVDCWQGLLERSPLRATHALLNYGMGGYGLDQVLLLMQLALDRQREHAPTVIVGILVDDDLDRCYLALRNGPKPRYTLGEHGELVLHPVEHTDALSAVRADPIGIRSYLWRLFLFQSGLVARSTAIAWSGEGDHVRVKKELAERLIPAIQHELESRGMPYFFVLFHGRRGFAAEGPFGWQEPLLYALFEQHGIPFVSSKRFLRAYVAGDPRRLDALFFASGPEMNHYTPEANAVVFEALLEGLAGRFEPYDYLAER